MTMLRYLLVLALVAAPVRADVDAANYIRTVQALYQLVALEPPPGPDGFGDHRTALAASVKEYRTRWLEPARPFLASVVPTNLPERVVYPFGGGDLLTALVTFPAAREITTISLEHSGEPVTLGLDPREFEGELAILRKDLDLLFRKAHSRTDHLAEMQRLKLPAQVIFALTALSVLGHQPVGLRYFHLAPDGSLKYVTDGDVAATTRGTPERWRLFSNMELSFVPRGSVPGAPPIVHRHINFSLDNAHLAKDPSLLRHLEAKGKVAVMTKAASFLLWQDSFSSLRSYLLAHAAFMVSDSTGIPPRLATAAGFELRAFGRFEEPLFSAPAAVAADFRELFKNARPLPVRYGYPDHAGHAHLIVMRPRAP